MKLFFLLIIIIATLTSAERCPYLARNADLLSALDLSSTLSAIESLVNATVDSEHLHSVSLSIRVEPPTNKSSVFMYNYGYASERKETPDAGQLYRIGSNTKLFTVLLLLEMLDAGLVRSLDDPVILYEPLFRVAGASYENGSITLRQLASHTAGLMREAPCFPALGGCNVSSAQLYERLAAEPLVLQPGTTPSYSNVGFAVLGNVLGRVLGGDVHAVAARSDSTLAAYMRGVRDRVVVPLLGAANADEAVFGRPPTSRLAVGRADGVRVPWLDFQWQAPAGQMAATPRAMATLLGRALFARASVLRASTAREWLMQRYVDADGRSGYAMPWEMSLLAAQASSSPAVWLRTKNGLVPGYSSETVVVAEQRLTMFVATGAGPPARSRSLATRIAALLVPAVQAHNLASARQFDAGGNDDDRLLLGEYRLARVPEEPWHLHSTLALVNVTRASGGELAIEGYALDGRIVAMSQTSLALRLSTARQQRGAHNSNSAPAEFVYSTLPTFEGSSYTSSCAALEGGHYQQTVRFAKQANSIELSINGLYYGFVFNKL
jgi:CubicO group peptidase (beta-lactamase class C family)